MAYAVKARAHEFLELRTRTHGIRDRQAEASRVLGKRRAVLRLAEAGGVERNAAASNMRISAASKPEMQLNRFVESGCQVMVEPKNRDASDLVTYHDDVGLRTMQQPERDPRKRGMKDGSLPLDYIPMIIGRRWGQHFGRPCDEISNNSINRHTRPRNENSGLPGSAEFRCHAAFREG